MFLFFIWLGGYLMALAKKDTAPAAKKDTAPVAKKDTAPVAKKDVPVPAAPVAKKDVPVPAAPVAAKKDVPVAKIPAATTALSTTKPASDDEDEEEEEDEDAGVGSVGSLMELIMDSVDYDNYRTSFMRVTVISCNEDEDDYVVGSYVGSDLMKWSVSSSYLISPRGPEMFRVFSVMEDVDVFDENDGNWWGATIISENAGQYSVIWKASFDGLSSISTVPKRFVRSATKVFKNDYGKKRGRVDCDQLVAEAKKKQSV
jgi:hypothetical protein